MKCFPRDEARLPEVAHPVGEPGVDVEGERRTLERLQRSKVDRHCVGDEFVAELGAQDDDRFPERSLLGIPRRPPELVLVRDGVADAGAGNR